MDQATVLTYVGAVTGIAAFLWNVYEFWQERKPRIRTMREMVTLTWHEPSEFEIKATEVLLIRITNCGKSPLSIVEFFLGPTILEKPVPYSGTTLDGTSFPFLLSAGECKEIHYPIENISRDFHEEEPLQIACWVEDAFRRRHIIPKAKQSGVVGARMWVPKQP